MRILDRFLPILLFLFALVIRLAHYTTADISMDEPFTLFHCQKSLAELWELFNYENTPPLFYLIAHFWIKIFGIEAEYVRVLPVIFSAATAGVIFCFGKRYFSAFSGLLAALMFLFTDIHQYHAHDVRTYSLFVLLTVASMYWFLKLAKTGSVFDVIILTLVNMLLLYDHFLAVYVILTQAVAVLLIRDFRTAIIPHYAVSTLIALGGFLPYVLLMVKGSQVSTGSAWLNAPTLVSLYNTIWTFSNAPVLAVVGIAILVLVPVVLLSNGKLSFNAADKMATLWFLVPLVAIFIVSQWIPMFMDRYLMLASIGYSFVVLRLLEKLPFGKVAMVVLMAGFALTFNIKAGHEAQIRSLVQHVKGDINVDRPLLISPEWNKLQVAYHFDKDMFSDHKNLDERMRAAQIYAFHDGHFIEEGKLPSSPSVIYLDPDKASSPMTSSTLSALSQRYSAVRVDDRFFPFMLHYFSKPK